MEGGYMRHIILIFFTLAALMLYGCSVDKAAELYDIAGFEELQNNREHALQLYLEIVTKYPDSDYARKAEEKILKLRQK